MRLDPYNTEDRALTIHLRYYNNRGYSANFWADSFRLLIADVPSAPLNNLNELQYGGADLDMMEHAPGCANNPATGFIACPVNPYYQTGGFGLITKSSAYRWSGDLKSTHIFEAGGHNELKYGWHLDYSTLDLDRHYSGGAFEQAFFANNQQGLPPGIFNTSTYFSLPPGLARHCSIWK